MATLTFINKSGKWINAIDHTTLFRAKYRCTDSLFYSLSLVKESRLYSTEANDSQHDKLILEKSKDVTDLQIVAKGSEVRDIVDINRKFRSKFKLDKKTMLLAKLKYKEESILNKFSESELNDMKDLETRIDSPFIHDFVLVESFKNIDCVDNNFMDLFSINQNNTFIEGSSEVGNNLDMQRNDCQQVLDVDEVFDQNQYVKERFIFLLQKLDSSRLYKVIFRWQSFYFDSLGQKRFSFNTSPSFFIYREMPYSIVLYRFVSYLNSISSNYNLSDRINLDVFVKEWISYDKFNSFDRILDTIKKSDKRSMISLRQQSVRPGSDKLNLSDNNRSIFLNRKGFFDNHIVINNNNIYKKGSYVFLSVKGLNYGDLINVSEISDVPKLELFNYVFNLDQQNIKLYKYFNNNINYILKVEEKDDKTNIVSVYLVDMFYQLLEHKEFDINNMQNLLHIEKWIDTISYDVQHNKIVQHRISENNGYKVSFIDDKLLTVDVVFNSKVLKQSYYDFDRDDNLGSIDIETYVDDKGGAVPYSIGFKTEDRLFTSYLSDYDNSDDMLLDCIDKLCIVKYHNMKVYAHNMS